MAIGTCPVQKTRSRKWNVFASIILYKQKVAKKNRFLSNLQKKKTFTVWFIKSWVDQVLWSLPYGPPHLDGLKLINLVLFWALCSPGSMIKGKNVHVYTCTQCTHAHTHTYAQCTHAQMHTMHTCTHAHTPHVYMFTCTHVDMYTCTQCTHPTCVHVHMHTCTHANMYTLVWVWLYQETDTVHSMWVHSLINRILYKV